MIGAVRHEESFGNHELQGECSTAPAMSYQRTEHS